MWELYYKTFNCGFGARRGFAKMIDTYDENMTAWEAVYKKRLDMQFEIEKFRRLLTIALDNIAAENSVRQQAGQKDVTGLLAEIEKSYEYIEHLVK